MKDWAKNRREQVSHSACEKKGWVCTQVIDTESNTDWQGTLWQHWCSECSRKCICGCVCVCVISSGQILVNDAWWTFTLNTASKATESIDKQHLWVSQFSFFRSTLVSLHRLLLWPWIVLNVKFACLCVCLFCTHLWEETCFPCFTITAY